MRHAALGSHTILSEQPLGSEKSSRWSIRGLGQDEIFSDSDTGEGAIDYDGCCVTWEITTVIKTELSMTNTLVTHLDILEKPRRRGVKSGCLEA